MRDYPFKDFIPFEASQDELRAFIRYWLAKWPPVSEEERTLRRIMKSRKTKIQYVSTHCGTCSPHPKYPAHIFEAKNSDGCIKFYVIEGLEP